MTVTLPNGTPLDFTGRPLVMAIVNCTEDSFYSGSHNRGVQAAVDRALRAESG
jgi:dihydropteroate synthase